jgi:hypothetical protein
MMDERPPRMAGCLQSAALVGAVILGLLGVAFVGRAGAYLYGILVGQ